MAGYDSREGGQVYTLPLGGTLVKVPFSIGELWQRLVNNAVQGWHAFFSFEGCLR